MLSRVATFAALFMSIKKLQELYFQDLLCSDRPYRIYESVWPLETAIIVTALMNANIWLHNKCDK